MAEFIVSGINYRSHKMPVMQQFHIARRLAPIFSTLAGAAAKLQFVDGKIVGGEELIEPVAAGLASLSDADSEFVINACLNVTQRQQAPTLYAPVIAGGRLMFDDIGLKEMMQITWAILQETMTPFFPGLSTKSPKQTPQA